MEFRDLKAFGNQDTINAEAEKLRDKVYHESANIIKSKVAQDTAYWDLKEKLQQVENNHERLRQNMVEVQMQHAATSSRCQDELRLRSETLNKLNSTRAICDVLENHCKTLRETLTRCKADQAALYETYQNTLNLMRDLRFKQEQLDHKTKELLESLREKVALSKDHQYELIQYFTATKQQTDSDLAEARAQLTSIQTQKCTLLSTEGNLHREFDKYKNELVKKGEMLTNIQNEKKRIIEENNFRISDALKTIAKQEQDVKDAFETYASLKQAVSNQEQFTKSICDEKNILQEKVTALKEKQNSLAAVIDTLKIQLEDTSAAKSITEGDVEKIIVENKDLNEGIFDYIQQWTDVKQQVKDLQLQINELSNEKASMALQMSHTKEDLKQNSCRIEQLVSEETMLKENLVEIENLFKSFREAMEEKIKAIETDLQSNNKEIDSKTNTITHLKTKVKDYSDAQLKLESIVQKLKSDMEVEREDMKGKQRNREKEKEVLTGGVRDKEVELGKRMSMILEMRNEKERLLEKIQGMQQTVDNIQKELTGKTPQPAREPAEMDDNAVTFTPPHTNMPPQKLTREKKPEMVVRLSKQEELEMFHLFSDSSREEPLLNTSLVERRFAALSRGEHVPLAALRRRPDVSRTNLTPQQSQEQGARINDSTKNKNRKFFKHKRLHTNVRK